MAKYTTDLNEFIVKLFMNKLYFTKNYFWLNLIVRVDNL